MQTEKYSRTPRLSRSAGQREKTQFIGIMIMNFLREEKNLFIQSGSLNNSNRILKLLEFTDLQAGIFQRVTR